MKFQQLYASNLLTSSWKKSTEKNITWSQSGIIAISFPILTKNYISFELFFNFQVFQFI
jgi:hypothetical protein